MNDPNEEIPEILTPDTPDAEPGMNFISTEFDLVMVNRANERLYGKPMTALLGRKCYREFERRDEPCPHCPGRLTLATGQPHETETIGTRDDGTRFFARIRTHPVIGPDNKPTGFIEVVEDITEQKLTETLAHIEADLQSALVSAKTVQRALREALDAALRIEGVEWGCVFLTGTGTNAPHPVHQRDVPAEYQTMLDALCRDETGDGTSTPADDRPAVEVVQISHRGDQVATLLLGTSGGREISPTPRSALRSLGAITGNAISRIRAEQSRGDAVADLEAFINIAPVAAWVLDRAGRITMWNKTAERLFGWQASEVVGQTQPFGNVHLDRSVCVIADKGGHPVDVRLTVAPFRDIVGNDSSTIVVAEDLGLQKRLDRLERRLAGDGSSADETAVAKPSESCDGLPLSGGRVLIVDSDEPWGHQLAGILTDLGYTPWRCASIDEAAILLTEAQSQDHPFVLTVVDLVTPSGLSGLSHKAILRELGLKAPVVVSCDAEVRGYEQYDIAAVIKRPHEPDAVCAAIREVLTARD